MDTRAGREILIKSVVQTLLSYAMNAFLLLLKIIKDIERSLAKFWWELKPNNKSDVNYYEMLKDASRFKYNFVFY